MQRGSKPGTGASRPIPLPVMASPQIPWRESSLSDADSENHRWTCIIVWFYPFHLPHRHPRSFPLSLSHFLCFPRFSRFPSPPLNLCLSAHPKASLL